MKNATFLCICLFLSQGFTCEPDTPIAVQDDAGPSVDGGTPANVGPDAGQSYGDGSVGIVGPGDAGFFADGGQSYGDGSVGIVGPGDAGFFADGGHVAYGDGGSGHWGGADGGTPWTLGDAGSFGPDSGVSGGDGDGASMCTVTPVAVLCVRGTQVADGEKLTADTKVKLQLLPKGCHSSACTLAEQASCSASLAGSDLTVKGNFCLRSEGACNLPDCGGGGTADCDSGQTLPNGTYTAKLGDLSVTFTIPSTLPFGGTCVGSPF